MGGRVRTESQSCGTAASTLGEGKMKSTQARKKDLKVAMARLVSESLE